MKYHKVVNNNKEDIVVKCRFSNIEYRIRHPYTFEYLDGLSGYIEDYTKFLKTLTLKVPEELKYKPGTKYARSTIVVHNSQVFVVIAENGTTREPFPYSDDWIALTDSYGNKCVAVTKYEEGGGATDDTFDSVNYGNFGLQDMTDILISGKYYDYFNDGDYMIIFDRSGNKFTMRMNYREYINEGGTTNASVDFISDELIPDIVINPNDTFGIEGDGVKYINNFSNVPIHKFSMVPDRLDTFVYQLPNALLGLLNVQNLLVSTEFCPGFNTPLYSLLEYVEIVTLLDICFFNPFIILGQSYAIILNSFSISVYFSSVSLQKRGKDKVL